MATAAPPRRGERARRSAPHQEGSISRRCRLLVGCQALALVDGRLSASKVQMPRTGPAGIIRQLNHATERLNQRATDRNRQTPERISSAAGMRVNKAMKIMASTGRDSSKVTETDSGRDGPLRMDVVTIKTMSR